MRKLTCGKPQVSHGEYIAMRRYTGGTETSKYPEEEKEKSIFRVAASEKERAQTAEGNFCGVEDWHNAMEVS
jgi:hypothetical protein